MHGLQATGSVRTTLEVITPSPGGLTPEQWKQTATLCPLDWPTNFSLLRLWHTQKSLHQFADLLHKQMNHRHMFSHWLLDHEMLASRVLFQGPARYVPEATLQEHVRRGDFPSRRVRRRLTNADQAEFTAKCVELRQLAAALPSLMP